jgi:hypothetical protein
MEWLLGRLRTKERPDTLGVQARSDTRSQSAIVRTPNGPTLRPDSPGQAWTVRL